MIEIFMRASFTCDGCGKKEWVESKEDEYLNAEAQKIKELVDNGWISTGGKHLCSACSLPIAGKS